AIESYIGLLMQPDFNYKNGILEISVNVGTYFSKGFSWVKGNAQQPKVLLHEQYRMRLAHYYTLQLKKKLEKASLTYENYAKNIQQIYHDINDAANVEMRQYDSETKFGITKKEQEKWQKKIEDELSSAENQSN
ncbi:MAG TPA: hypothetical protein VKT28_02125, partial [Puia sp.]|nr:hypothetical protein [Puia sp.]